MRKVRHILVRIFKAISDPKIIKLGQEIIASREAEIAQMKAKLEELDK